MTKICNIDTVYPQRGDKYILDACVLLYIFFTLGGYEKSLVRQYSTFYSNIVKSNAKILLSINLLSEFFNRFLKLEYKIYLKENGYESSSFTYKQYRKTDNFLDVIKELNEIFTYQLLPYSEFITHDINEEIIIKSLNSSNVLDFNDVIYACSSEKYSAPIVTHDKDYFSLDNSMNVTIITNHKK